MQVPSNNTKRAKNDEYKLTKHKKKFKTNDSSFNELNATFYYYLHFRFYNKNKNRLLQNWIKSIVSFFLLIDQILLNTVNIFFNRKL